MHIDPTLLKDGDSRNVIDAYKTWTIDAIANDMRVRSFPIHIAIENFQHDYNIGTIVRNANAFNVRSVHIIGKRHWNRRGAMATEKYLDVNHHTTIASFTDWVVTQSLPLIGIDNIPSSTSLARTDLPKECVFVFGQEGPGLSAEMQDTCESIIAIEQFGSTRSINVGVAAGIILYEWVRRYSLA